MRAASMNGEVMVVMMEMTVKITTMRKSQRRTQ
jgi:hypothetical protein